MKRGGLRPARAPARDQTPDELRLAGLRRFALAITLLTLLGHALLGFEPSWAQPLVALGTAYALELLLECAGAWSARRRPCFLAGWRELVNLLLPAHISALAIAMLLYPGTHLGPVAFAAAAAIGSKALFRAHIGRGERHFLNPSNGGIALTLLLFPSVGISPPYQFTERLQGAADWLLPLLIVASGSFLNARFTRRLPLIAAWLAGFVLQAALRSALLGAALPAALAPMSGVAFLLFTFYMATDPATTPSRPGAQLAFGFALAAAYGALLVAHAVFGLFFALALTCAARGFGLAGLRWLAAQRRALPAPAPRAGRAALIGVPQP